MRPVHGHLADFSHKHFDSSHPSQRGSPRNAIFAPHFPPQPHSGGDVKFPLALHSLVTAYLQRSQARARGTAPRSGLGDRGVSQETEHKYRDPNNLITSGDIRPRILEAYPGGGCLCLERGSRGVAGGLDGQ